MLKKLPKQVLIVLSAGFVSGFAQAQDWRSYADEMCGASLPEWISGASQCGSVLDLPHHLSIRERQEISRVVSQCREAVWSQNMTATGHYRECRRSAQEEFMALQLLERADREARSAAEDVMDMTGNSMADVADRVERIEGALGAISDDAIRNIEQGVGGSRDSIWQQHTRIETTRSGAWSHLNSQGSQASTSASNSSAISLAERALERAMNERREQQDRLRAALETYETLSHPNAVATFLQGFTGMSAIFRQQQDNQRRLEADIRVRIEAIDRAIASEQARGYLAAGDDDCELACNAADPTCRPRPCRRRR